MTEHGIRGFTLIELMITIAIIGVLAAFALPAYRNYVETSNMTKVNAASENAIRVLRNEMQKNQTRVSMGLPPTLPSNDKEWVRRLDPRDRFEAPGGGPLYVYYGQQNIFPSKNGSVMIMTLKNGDVRVIRPAYLKLEQRWSQLNVTGVVKVGK